MKKQRMKKNDENMASMVTLYESYFMKIFKIFLHIDDLAINIYQDEDPRSRKDWAELRATSLGLDIDCLCFETNTKITFDRLVLTEKQVLHRNILTIEKASSIFLKLLSLCSPTIDNSLMDCDVKLGGSPILFFDPVFINQIMKYFKDTENQEAKEVFQYIFDAF
jgi:hypothetical protein